jgi:hypothetical protein
LKHNQHNQEIAMPKDKGGKKIKKAKKVRVKEDRKSTFTQEPAPRATRDESRVAIRRG